jgi:hypothetical protein
MVAAVRRAARVVRGSSCLAQSMALTGLLAQQGDECDLVLGCWLGENGWTAHAWVESAGWRLEPVYGGAQVEIARCSSADGWVLRPAEPVKTPLPLAEVQV